MGPRTPPGKVVCWRCGRNFDMPIVEAPIYADSCSDYEPSPTIDEFMRKAGINVGMYGQPLGKDFWHFKAIKS